MAGVEVEGYGHVLASSCTWLSGWDCDYMGKGSNCCPVVHLWHACMWCVC